MDKIKPLLSVCVQTYQHLNFIKECLDGILIQQTTFPFEIILGEDESNDGTREICIEYSEKYPDKIKLFLRNRKDVIYINGNATGRYNFIENLKACSGKYIAICEGDDYWTDPLKLQKQVDVLEVNSHLIGCFHNSEERYWKDYSKASKLYVPYSSNKEITISDLAQYNIIPTCSVVFKNLIPEEVFTNEFLGMPFGDWSLHLLNARNGNYYYIPQVMSVRNLNPTSTWGMKDQKKNTEKMIIGINLLIKSTWFNDEIVDLLVFSRKRLEETLTPKIEFNSFTTYKNKFIDLLVSALVKMK